MKPRQRDVWLVPIPFSDLTSTKRRPVVVISHDRYNKSQADCLVMGITSQVEAHNAYGVVFMERDLVEGTLPRPSQIRIDKIYSVHQKILIRRFGRLAEEKYRAVIMLLQQLIAE